MNRSGFYQIPMDLRTTMLGTAGGKRPMIPEDKGNG
jgi:hypothetical protein